MVGEETLFCNQDSASLIKGTTGILGCYHLICGDHKCLLVSPQASCFLLPPTTTAAIKQGFCLPRFSHTRELGSSVWGNASLSYHLPPEKLFNWRLYMAQSCIVKNVLRQSWRWVPARLYNIVSAWSCLVLNENIAPSRSAALST